MKVAIVSATVAALTFVMAGSAYAAVTSSKEGQWNQGMDRKYGTTTFVYSDYFHATKQHKSTAQGTAVDTSGWVVKGYWAKSEVMKASSGNKTNYDFRS